MKLTIEIHHLDFLCIMAMQMILLLTIKTVFRHLDKILRPNQLPKKVSQKQVKSNGKFIRSEWREFEATSI